MDVRRTASDDSEEGSMAVPHASLFEHLWAVSGDRSGLQATRGEDHDEEERKKEEVI